MKPMKARPPAKALRAARKRLYNAEAELERLYAARYPVGGGVVYSRSGSVGLATGDVLDHGAGYRLKVRNRRTGKEYWISFWDIQIDYSHE